MGKYVTILKRGWKIHSWFLDREKRKRDKLLEELKDVFLIAYGFSYYWKKKSESHPAIKDLNTITCSLSKLLKVKKKYLRKLEMEEDITNSKYKRELFILKTRLDSVCKKQGCESLNKIIKEY